MSEIRRRTPGEATAYLDGYRAGINVALNCMDGAMSRAEQIATAVLQSKVIVEQDERMTHPAESSSADE